MDAGRANRNRWQVGLAWTGAWIGLFLAARAARSDLIYFRGGGQAQLAVTEESSGIVVDLPDGRLVLRPDDILKRVPGYCPAEEWETRLKAAHESGTAARHEAVWWGIENGLTAEVAEELRALHAVDPGHAPTSRMLAILDRLDRSCPDPEFAEFRSSLGVETKIARGPHILLLHQHGEAEARERVELLERVVTGFHLLFAAEGLGLRTPRHRLVSAWFAERQDYLDFLHRQGADAFSTTGGYYHPTWDAVVAWDARSGDRQRASRAVLATRQSELRELADGIQRMPANGRLRLRLGDEPARMLGRSEGLVWLNRLDREAAFRTMLLDLEWRSLDMGLAAHEMVHQLTVDSGLAARHDAFPYWLHEGLAAQFEVVRGGRWAGISRANDLRLPDWRAARPSPRLERLLRDGGFGHGYRRDLYAQAWALVYYLRTRHAGRFVTFLDLLRNPDEDATSSSASPEARGERTVVAFRRAIGADLESVERDWLSFMAEIRTPLELNAPKPGSTAPHRAATRFVEPAVVPVDRSFRPRS
jgi:hypothetical protein